MNLNLKDKKIFNSFKYAFEGILSSLKTEKNMKFHMLAMIFVIILGIYFKINKVEWCICIICIVLVISTELVNTAIETVVDMICPEKNDKAKLAKDVAAGAVLVLALGAIVIGLIIFLPKVLALF